MHVHVHVPYERHADKVMKGKEWMHASSLIMAFPVLDTDQHAKVMSRIVENLRGGGGNVPRIDQVSTLGGMALLHASPGALCEQPFTYHMYAVVVSRAVPFHFPQVRAVRDPDHRVRLYDGDPGVCRPCPPVVLDIGDPYMQDGTEV